MSVTYGNNNQNAGAVPVDTVIKTTSTTDGEVQHVNVDTSALPSGAATAAGQASLLAELQNKADTTDIQPIVIQDADGTAAKVEARKQTPTGNALNVQIGPGDVVSNIPVMIEFDHHQRHEGETHRIQYVDTGLDTNTVKFAFVVPSYSPTINAPHVYITAFVYNGAARLDIYEGATYTGGTPVTAFNINRNSAITPGVTGASGVTSTNGTLLPFSFFAGAGARAGDSSRSSGEFIAKASTTYRVDVIGLSAGTDIIVHFEWYEDLGV